MSEADLRGITGDHEDNRTMTLGCRQVFAAGSRSIEVVGPLATDEAMAVHSGFWVR